MKKIADQESEIKKWLPIILQKEKLRDISVDITGNSEKGDGYIGEIVFVQVSGTTEENLTKTYDLVLKCSKQGLASPLKDVFRNEIFIYDTLLPYFTQFQIEKGVVPFGSVPKCFGTFVSESAEVIAFENLRKSGYDLWPKKEPVTRKHLDLVVTEYAKYHAVSVALQDQRPSKFQEFADGLVDIVKKSIETGDSTSAYQKGIDKVAELLQGEIEEAVLLQWKAFREQVHYIFHDLINNIDDQKVIVHGDCWNNNFMYKNIDGNKNFPSEVKILDWQIARYASPILDLSYHLFTCASEEDLNDIDTILQDYHRNLSEQVKLLGSDPEALYTFSQFSKDWQKYSKFGILLSTLLMKICLTEKDDVVDLAQNAEDGKDMLQSFAYEIKDKENYKKRMRPIVEHAVRNHLI